MTEDLRKARADLRGILDHVPGMIGYWNRELRCQFANGAYLGWFERPAERVIGLHMAELLGERLFRMDEPHARQALLGHAQRFERSFTKADGSQSYTDTRYIPDVDHSGAVSGFFVQITDITDLRQSHARIRSLAQRLQTLREGEQKSLSRSLHEGIAQDLFAVKLTLEHLKTQAPAAGPHWSRELEESIDSCMLTARRLADEARPSSLALLSICEAIAQHAREVEISSGLAIGIAENNALPALDDACRLALFRAAQEALANIVRHAHATTVQIALDNRAGVITLDVIDDGCGIDEDALARPDSLGIFGLRERFEALGGGLTVARAVPKGTQLSVHLRTPPGTAD